VTSKPRAQLLLPIRNRAAFLDAYFSKNETGGLFVPGELDVELGDDVDVELHFTEEQVRFHIRARV
jgi:Tfp pilus assembly protein PilZ